MSTKMGALLRDNQSVIYRYLRESEVCKLMEQHQSGISNNSKILFSLVMLEQTLRIYTSARPALTAISSTRDLASPLVGPN